MGDQPRFCTLQYGNADRAPPSEKQRKSPETQRFQGFSGGRGRRARTGPLAVPEKIFGLPLFLDFFDRCANACSLYPPPAALAGVARHAALRERRSVCSRWDTPSRRCCEYPPPISRAADIRRAALVGSFRPDQKSTDTPLGVSVLFWQGQKGSNPRHAVLERLSGKEKSPIFRFIKALAASQNRS